MTKFFGPATARLVEEMSEEECIPACRQKVRAFLGEDAAEQFDSEVIQ